MRDPNHDKVVRRYQRQTKVGNAQSLETMLEVGVLEFDLKFSLDSIENARLFLRYLSYIQEDHEESLLWLGSPSGNYIQWH